MSSKLIDRPKGWMRASIAVTSACLLVLLGIAGERIWLRSAPASSDAYHERVAAAVEAIPFEIGDWEGKSADPPEAAVRILRPNAIAGRRFVHGKTREVATLLVVHCRDARDMSGHYPPACYPSQGWTLLEKAEEDWTVGDRVIPSMNYLFVRESIEESSRMRVCNFIVYPGRPIVRYLAESQLIALDPRLRGFGAGQVQVVIDGRVKPERRQEIVRELLGGILDALAAMQSEVTE